MCDTNLIASVKLALRVTAPRAVRRADGARSRRQRAAARSLAPRMARRQFAACAQPALHARRAAGRAGGGLHRRGVLAGPAQGDGWPHRRGAGPAGDPRQRHLPALDAPPWRAFPAVAVGGAAHRAHQCVFHGRRQGAGQCLLPQCGTAGRAGALRHAGGPAGTAGRPLRGRLVGRPALCGARLRAGLRRLREQPRLAA